MARVYRTCPHCRRRVPPGGACPCGCGRRDRSAEPWRARYCRAEFKGARQAVLERQHGMCAACGTPIARPSPAGWRTFGGAGIHHKVPLRIGGTDDPSNLVGLCASCHAKADAAIRKRERAG